MASIQQSMNQMLGSLAGLATAGSYMYRQTPAFQEKKELEFLDRKANKLYNALEETAGQSGGEEGTPGWESLRKLEEEDIRTKRRALELDPTEERAAGYIRAMKEYGLDFPDKKAEAENSAVSRLETRSMTAREMLASLVERKDLLSAKERGQLTTMMGRHKEKGGIDI